MNDLISRQAAIAAMNRHLDTIPVVNNNTMEMIRRSEVMDCREIINGLPSAQPEPLTDKEQRIFLAAMGREEKVCKQVDAECRDCREPYEDSLVSTCHEITRKVKGALWT